MSNEMESQMAQPEASPTQVVAKKKATVRISLPPKPSAKQTIKIMLPGPGAQKSVLTQIKPSPDPIPVAAASLAQAPTRPGVAIPPSIPKRGLAPPPFGGPVGRERVVIHVETPNSVPVGIISPTQNAVVQHREPPPQGVPTDNSDVKRYSQAVPPVFSQGETEEISTALKPNNAQPVPNNTQLTPNKEENMEDDSDKVVVYNGSRVVDIVLLTVALMVMIALFFVIRWNVNKLDGVSSGMPQKTSNIVAQKTK